MDYYCTVVNCNDDNLCHKFIYMYTYTYMYGVKAEVSNVTDRNGDQTKELLTGWRCVTQLERKMYILVFPRIVGAITIKLNPIQL